MSETPKQLAAGQALVKKTMDEVVQQQDIKQKVTIEARQEFKESYSSHFEEEFEEESFTDEFGNTTTTSSESSSESEKKSKSADVQVKATGLNKEQVQALEDAANEAGQLALNSPSSIPAIKEA